uniref:F-box associated domain-containing protein n=2 Tax=Aegilops tauschii subsp. strangulata TaxID=200361 RepID=A0A453JCY0_AEGTS
KDGRLCIVYASDDFLLHVWTRSVNADGIEIWVLQNIISLSVKIDRIIGKRALGLQARLTVVQVRCGYVYLSMTCMTPVGTLHCRFFSLSLETTDLELLVEGCFDDRPCPYIMAWPSCLVGDDGSTGHEVEGSH